MKIRTLDKNIYTNKETGFLCRYVRSETEHFCLHNHNYYEIFIVLKGTMCHIVNSVEQILTEGHILFIRDFDAHNYKSADGNQFEFLNIAFTKDYFYDLTQYLGKKFPADALSQSKLPPISFITEVEKEKLFYSVTNLMGNDDTEMLKLKLRAFLVNTFTKYFCDYHEEESGIPLWLELSVEKMKMPSNFVQGTVRFYEICNKSREHLSRSFKKYYGITIHDFINNLKLEYSKNLLTGSNLTITDICYESGFENLSWYYKLFIKKYGVTPSEYRKKYRIYS